MPPSEEVQYQYTSSMVDEEDEVGTAQETEEKGEHGGWWKDAWSI